MEKFTSPFDNRAFKICSEIQTARSNTHEAAEQSIHLMTGTAKRLVERTGLSLELKGIAIKAPYLRVACIE